MLYGSDYRSVDDRDGDGRLLRRFRRDVALVAARPQEVAATGLVAGLAIVPLLLLVSTAAGFGFAAVFHGGSPDRPPVGAGVADMPLQPTSRLDFVLVLAAIVAVLGIAGGLSALLRRYDYERRGGLHYYLHHPRSLLGMLGFFAPVTALVCGGLLLKAARSPHTHAGGAVVATPSLFDRGVLYLFVGILLSMLLYLIWESSFLVIFPTLSDLDLDAEVNRRQQEDLARIRAEEERLREGTLVA